ncbi:MAG: hypothetical protein HYX68_09995 [Planctomycetes bacterium]|nr:hypothetical protein [Planctomycetota bacterium]
MTQRWIYFFGNHQADGSGEIKHLIGGKGASLADMTRAGLNVPPGFTISAECCDYYYKHGKTWPDGLEAELRTSLQRLEDLAGRKFGVGAQPLLVAVRSGAAQSMPGMMDTLLNVGDPSQGDAWTALKTAIDAVFESWHSERALAYRKHHQINDLLGTAVTVQTMCPAEVAGILFTANPVNEADEIIMEAAPGLGEAIVLGKVTPDRFVLDKGSLAFKERVLADPEAGASLADGQIQELAQLGLRVETHFQSPCDIEWALFGGQFFLLQSRPIRFKGSAGTPISLVDQENARAREVAALKAMAEPTGTVWARFNLSEILPEPTPMTWSIVRQFMSGKGGFGQMYRDLGFDPDPALDEIGMFDLICGRPYCNLSREPRMQYKNLPFEHNFAFLKKNPDKAIYPQATFNPRRAGLMFFFKVPLLFLKMWWSQIKQQQLIRTFVDDFTQHIVPNYLALVEKAERVNLGALSSEEVVRHLNEAIQLTLFDFARHSLKPTALAALMLANLERAFAARLQPVDMKPAEAMAIGLQKAQTALRELMMGAHPDEHTDLAAGIRALREGRLSKDEFLKRFGHRGSQEMELSKPRWAEDHTVLDRMTQSANQPGAQATGSAVAATPSLARRAGVDDAWQMAWFKLADEARLLPNQRPAVEAELRRLQTYMGLRETAKHHLMRGYALIRRGLLELDRRYQLDGGVFDLTITDLAALARLPEGKTPTEHLETVDKNRRQRAIALSLTAPTVLFSDDLNAIGRQAAFEGAGVLQGTPLSAGIVEGTAWVLDDVAGAEMPVEPYILVCPSTDPAWVPLFVQARGLVMETGGMLSHGAIVAREFGLPAVAGIANVHRRIKTGQRLRMDGGTGAVQIVAG